MKRIKQIFLFGLLCCCFLVSAQTKVLNGRVIGTEDVEGIHILNRTESKYAITEEDGTFSIVAKLVDTLVISGLKYQPKQVVITKYMVDAEYIEIWLEEKITVLDEVIVGRILTGSLSSDISNSDAETNINFYDLGIPGFTGTPLTQTQRRLFDADAGKTFSIMGGPFGGGAGINLNKLLNKISGRTKRLKTHVRIEANEKCINYFKNEYSKALFEKEPLDEVFIEEYFQFCEDDPVFTQLCSSGNALKTIEFLQNKLKIYKNNLQISHKD